MENLKVYVKDEVESEEVQKLLFDLNCYWYGERSVDKNNIVEPSSPYPRYIHTNEFGRMYYCAEHNRGSLKTKQQLRDLVILKRNSIDDASFKDTFGDIWYVDSTNSYWMFENGIWREADKPLFKLEPIKKEGEVKMKEKEYIANVSGDWRLVESHELVSGRVEVPEGAEEYRTNYKFYKNDGKLYYSSYGEWTESGLAEYITLWKRGTTEHKNKTQDKLGSNKGEVMKEFLNPEQGYALVKCFVGETPIHESWIEVPEGAEILYFDKRYESANNFFKTVDGKAYYKYLENGSEWIKYDDVWLEDFKESIDNFRIMWQRNPETPNTLIQEKLKFIEKWLNGEKIQYILGIKSEKTQADKYRRHNFTEGAMQYIKRPDIKFREAPKYVTINGIEFKSVEKLLNYVKNNFDLEDGE